MYCWRLAFRILSITLLACEVSAFVVSLRILWDCLSLGIGMKTDLFKSCGHSWFFQMCWRIECSNFIAPSFRIWKSSTGIPSHPLAFFLVIPSKVYLTSHSRMSGSRWVTTPSWLSGSWRSFFYSSSVYSCHLFFVSYIPVSYAILLFIASNLASITIPILNWVLFLLWLHPFILSGVIPQLFSSSILGTFWPVEILFQYPIILPFHTVHGVLKARIL